MLHEGHPLFQFSSFVSSLLFAFVVVSSFWLCRHHTVEKENMSGVFLFKSSSNTPFFELDTLPESNLEFKDDIDAKPSW